MDFDLRKCTSSWTAIGLGNTMCGKGVLPLVLNQIDVVCACTAWCDAWNALSVSD